MNQLTPAFPGVVDSEISALIVTLHETERRLESLTAGQVDTVADPDGRTFLLREAQEQLRHREATKQAAILNALPANIALLDQQGVVVSVNDGWRYFPASVAHAPGCAVGENYLDNCARRDALGGAESRRIARGIRSFLDGAATGFSTEYNCDSMTGKRWFLLTVSPLAHDCSNGLVVMHVDMTAERLACERLRATELKFAESERRLSDMLDNVDMASLMLDCESRITYCNDYLLGLIERRREDVLGQDWFSLFDPSEGTVRKGDFEADLLNRSNAWHQESKILTASGDRRLVHWNNTVLRSAIGKVIGMASIGEDITERKQAEQVLTQRTIELERFHRLSVGRELQMIELKKQINELALKLGHECPYDLSFLAGNASKDP